VFLAAQAGLKTPMMENKKRRLMSDNEEQHSYKRAARSSESMLFPFPASTY
jgi:hypothetical protein